MIQFHQQQIPRMPTGFRRWQRRRRVVLLQHSVCEMDSFEPRSQQCLRPRNNQLQAKYREIGATLLIAEAAAYSAGIPWLPPTKVIRERVAAYRGPLSDFIRESFVGIDTGTLECYSSDLCSIDPAAAEALFIPMPHPLARYSLACIFSGSSFAAISLLCRSLHYPVTLAIPAALSVAVVCGAAGVVAASEFFRRRSFFLLLEREINRRRGADIKGGSPVMHAIETEPVSE